MAQDTRLKAKAVKVALRINMGELGKKTKTYRPSDLSDAIVSNVRNGHDEKLTSQTRNHLTKKLTTPRAIRAVCQISDTLQT